MNPSEELRVNALLLNRDGFQMPVDGWYQVAPLGEFAHAQAGVVQVVDREACEAMVNRFRAEAGIEPFDKLRADRFAGLLVDFDHFSLDGEKRSEAAGWVTDLEFRPGGEGCPPSHANAATAWQSPAGAGLWAHIRWSDVGEEAVKGGRYRFLSPVWARSDCVDLGPSPNDAGIAEGRSQISEMRRVRPVRLLNAAVTNDPNLKGMRPLSNSSTPLKSGSAEAYPPSPGSGATAPAGVPRLKWVLGESPEGRHCPSCEAMAGQVHTMAEWEAAGVKPGASGLYCQGHCHCRLEPTEEPATGEVMSGPMRKPAEVTNAGGRHWHWGRTTATDSTARY